MSNSEVDSKEETISRSTQFAVLPIRRALILSGVALESPLVMWSNFVARTRVEIFAAYDSGSSSDQRFGALHASSSRIDVASPLWSRHR